MKQKFLLTQITIALASFLMVSTATAENSEHHKSRHKGGPSAEKHLAHLDSALDLSDEQSAELLEVLQAAEDEREALHQAMMEQYRPEICALRDATEAEIAGILTPEQAAQFEDLQEGRKDRWQRRHEHRSLAALDC